MINNFKIYFFLIIISSVFLSINVFAQSTPPDVNTDVINYVKRNIAISTARFGKKVKFCDEKRETEFILDSKYLKSINATKKDIIVGLVYLDYNNTFNCRSEAQLRFAYDIGMLASIQRGYNLDYKNTLDIASNLIYPAIDNELEHVANYITLPLKLREYLEKSIGKKPFNLVQTVSKLNIK
ncbi:MAG: hypothetical protein GQ546_09265 [Gammaproteobacteria bacterium]|nr:hypothetical protein [Gammaproteobacteria bacterium]